MLKHFLDTLQQIYDRHGDMPVYLDLKICPFVSISEFCGMVTVKGRDMVVLADYIPDEISQALTEAEHRVLDSGGHVTKNAKRDH